MNWDYFVYGRGVEQSDGFRLRHAPEYLTDAVMKRFGGFFSLSKIAKDKVTFPKELLEKYSDPWHSSFLFFIMADLDCCVLARLVRKEGVNGEGEVVDFGGRIIWSMEGMCCRMEMLPLFFASVPSMILWLKQKGNRSMYTMNDSGEIKDKVSIPAEFEADLYDENENSRNFFDVADGMLSDKNERVAFARLLDAVKYADEPFSFVYGPLAEIYHKQLGGEKLLKKCISPEKYEEEQYTDKFLNITPITLKNGETKTITYDLKMVFRPSEKGECSYCWCICNKSEVNAAVMQGESVGFNGDEGVMLSEIMSEADSIRKWAANIGWTADTDDIDPIVIAEDKEKCRKAYSFEKEE